MTARLAHDDGFTLVELLIVMVISIALLGTILTGFERFAGQQTRASDAIAAQDAARTEVRSIVAELREARIATGQTTPIPATWATSRSDLVVATYVGSGASAVPGWVRYCAVTTSTSPLRISLIRGSRVGDAYAAPGPCASTAAANLNGWTHTAVVKDKLQDPTLLFDYASVACSGAACLPAAADVRSVGVRLAVARDVGQTTLGSVVRDAVSFRNRL